MNAKLRVFKTEPKLKICEVLFRLNTSAIAFTMHQFLRTEIKGQAYACPTLRVWVKRGVGGTHRINPHVIFLRIPIP